MQEDWQMRRQAVETFITLAAAVQVSVYAFTSKDQRHQAEWPPSNDPKTDMCAAKSHIMML